MGTTSEKLTYLNETKSKIKDNINLTGAGLTNQTPFRQYATGLKTALLNILNNGIDTLYNNFPQTTGTGTNITLNNTLEAPIKSELLGNTSQNGTPTPDAPVEVINATGEQVVKVVGKNLLNVTDVASTTTNGITYYRENQTYYLSGTNTKTDSVWVLPNNIITNLPKFEVGKNYTLKITGTLPSNVYVQVNAKNQSNSNYSLWSQISDTNAHTITIGSEYVSTAQVFIGIRQTATNVTGNFKIQIEEGSTATEYEAYKEQSYEINLGYNLFKTPYNESSITKNGITFTINEDGSIHVEGTATAKTQFKLRNRDLLLDLNIGERYTMATSGLGAADSTIWLDTYGQTGNFLGKWALTSNTPYTSAVAEAKDNKPFISITVENGATINTDVKVWLYKGSYDSSIEYTQYKTPIELCKIEDYQDSIRKGTGINLYNKSTMIEGKYINNTGAEVSNSNYYATDYIEVSPDKYLFLNGNTFVIQGYGAKASFYNSSKQFISYVDLSTSQNIFKIPSNAKYFRTSIYKTDIDSLYISYEPYGMYNKWYIEKQIGKVVLDGTEEGWNVRQGSNPNLYIFYLLNNSVQNSIRESGGFSNYFIENTTSGLIQYDGGFRITEYNSVNRIYLCVNNNIATTIPNFKTWLSTHNTELYYPLVTPTVEEITDSTLLNELNNLEDAKSYNGTTNIIITAETPADIKIIALKNE